MSATRTKPQIFRIARSACGNLAHPVPGSPSNHNGFTLAGHRQQHLRQVHKQFLFLILRCLLKLFLSTHDTQGHTLQRSPVRAHPTSTRKFCGQLLPLLQRHTERRLRLGSSSHTHTIQAQYLSIPTLKKFLIFEHLARIYGHFQMGC